MGAGAGVKADNRNPPACFSVSPPHVVGGEEEEGQEEEEDRVIHHSWGKAPAPQNTMHIWTCTHNNFFFHPLTLQPINAFSVFLSYKHSMNHDVHYCFDLQLFESKTYSRYYKKNVVLLISIFCCLEV